MYSFKKDTQKQGSGLPDICVVVAYNGKSYRLFNRDGNQLLPINKINADKWSRVSLPEIEKSLAEKLSADEIHILETKAERSTAGAITL